MTAYYGQRIMCLCVRLVQCCFCFRISSSMRKTWNNKQKVKAIWSWQVGSTERSQSARSQIVLMLAEWKGRRISDLLSPFLLIICFLLMFPTRRILIPVNVIVGIYVCIFTILGVIKKEKGTVPTWIFFRFTVKTKQAQKCLLYKVASDALDDLEVNWVI